MFLNFSTSAYTPMDVILFNFIKVMRQWYLGICLRIAYMAI